MKRLSYRLVVPSRHRPHHMPRLLSLLPDATVCVDVRERDDYAEFVPKRQLVTHPAKVIGEPLVRNWIIDHTKEPVLIQCDDDFIGVHVTTGSHRLITDADDIRDIFENAMQCCHDLGLTTFCFARTMQSLILDSDLRPIRPVQQVFNFIGTMGKARWRHYDESMPARCDVDWTLRTLLEDRIVYADVRFYFDFGQSLAGTGGLAGLRTKEGFEKGTAMLKERWGKHICFEAPGYVKNRRTSTGSIRVRRQSGKGLE